MEKRIIDDVLSVFKDNLKEVKYAENRYILTMPFFYNNGNPMTVGIVINSNDDYILTDMKDTFASLPDDKSSDFIMAKAQKILDKYEINLCDNEICIRCNKENLLAVFNRFVHVLILIDNLIG